MLRYQVGVSLRIHPARVTTFQVVLGDPPGPAAEPSDIDRNLVVDCELKQLLQRREPHRKNALADWLLHKE